MLKEGVINMLITTLQNGEETIRSKAIEMFKFFEGCICTGCGAFILLKFSKISGRDGQQGDFKILIQVDKFG